MIKRLVYFVRSLFERPFKIGLINYTYPKDTRFANGVEVVVYYLSRRLAKLGCDIHVFTSGEKNSIKKEYMGGGRLIIHRILSKFDFPVDDFLAKKRLANFVFDNKIINEITKENSKAKINIINTHGWIAAGAFISKFFNNIKWVHTFHSLERNRLKFMSEDEKKYSKIAKWMENTISYADALVGVSPQMEKEILQSYSIKREKVHYLPNGIDLSVFKAENPTTNEKIILYVGRFSLEKGIDLVPKIAKEVLSKNKETKFIVVAIGESVPSIEKIKEKFDELAEKYKDRFIIYTESLNREELTKLYNQASIVIQPSRYESFGQVALEAMACGDAVIVSNKGGLPDVIGNAGITLPLNSKVFSKEILKLLDNYRLRERYGRRGIKRARKYGWTSIARKNLELFKKISGEEQKKIKISKKIKLF